MTEQKKLDSFENVKHRFATPSTIINLPHMYNSPSRGINQCCMPRLLTPPKSYITVSPKNIKRTLDINVKKFCKIVFNLISGFLKEYKNLKKPKETLTVAPSNSSITITPINVNII